MNDSRQEEQTSRETRTVANVVLHWFRSVPVVVVALVVGGVKRKCRWMSRVVLG